MSKYGRSWQPLVSLLCVGMIAYFAYHAVTGRHGFERRLQLQQEASRLERELERLDATRDRLKRDVALMRADGVDPDMLSEQARRVLHFAHPKDVFITGMSFGARD